MPRKNKPPKKLKGSPPKRAKPRQRKIKPDRLRAAGFSEKEIQEIQEYCTAAEKAGRFSNSASLVVMNGEVQCVCWTIAEIMDKLRPGCWINSPKQHKNRGEATVRDKRPDNLIKVYLAYPSSLRHLAAGEYLWAMQISEKAAKIENIPFFSAQLALGDLVEIDQDRKVIKVLEHAARTRGLIYSDAKNETNEEITNRYTQIRERLEKYDITVEGVVPGRCSLSVPNDIDDEQLEVLADQLDAQLVVLDGEDDRAKNQ